MNRLLVVEDERKIRILIRDFFELKGYEVDLAENGEEALQKVDNNVYDIVFLDVMMPGMDGMKVCRKIREITDVPVLFLTAVYDEESKLKGYECGADDYITKPFSLEVLYAKTEALVKRYKKDEIQKGFLCTDSISMDWKRHRVVVDGKECPLANKEYEILKMFLEHKGQVITREQILNRVWGEDYFGYDRTVDTHIKKLRKAIGKAAEPLQTVYKVGYVWKE